MSEIPRDKIGALIVAAGRGTRAGLPYPKTLYPLQGKPILWRLLDVLQPHDPQPTVVVSPGGQADVAASLQSGGYAAHLVVQPEPRGMGHAVSFFKDSPAYAQTEHVILVWGDIPFVQAETIGEMVRVHRAHDNDFTFVTRVVDDPYTIVTRDAQGQVRGVVETREAGSEKQAHGEREMGLFLFRKEAVMSLLQDELPGKWGGHTGEHGFLYLIGHLVAKGYKVEAIPVATDMDLVSLNSLSDIRDYL